MDPITINSGDQTIQFTNREFIVNGTPYSYGSVTQLWHVPQKSVYAVQCNDQMVGLPYEEKDALKMQALLQRVAQSLNLTIEEYQPHKTQPAPEDAAAEIIGIHAEPIDAAADAEPNDIAADAESNDDAADTAFTGNGTFSEEADLAGDGSLSTDAVPPADEDASDPGDSSEVKKSGGILHDRRFVIEMVIGIALIIFGVIGFILRG